MRYFFLPFAGFLLVAAAGQAVAQSTSDQNGPAQNAPAQNAPTQNAPTHAQPAAPVPRPSKPAPHPASPPARTQPPARASAAQPAPPPVPPAPPMPVVPLAPPPLPVLPPPVAVPVRPAPAPVPAVVTNDAPGAVSTLPGGLRVTFGEGRFDLNPTTAAAIRDAASGATQGGATFTVSAYAAGAPTDPSAARRLSLSRALAVRSLLIGSGITSVHIYVKALGTADGGDPPDRADIIVEAANRPPATPPAPASAAPASAGPPSATPTSATPAPAAPPPSATQPRRTP
jgi:outer membrane protein OmpA-like peptidoglycan-associated protein